MPTLSVPAESGGAAQRREDPGGASSEAPPAESTAEAEKRTLQEAVIATLGHFALALLLLVVGWLLINWVVACIEHRLEKVRVPKTIVVEEEESEGEDEMTEDSDGNATPRKGRPIDPTLLTFTMKSVKISLKIMLILICASLVGVQTASFIAILTAMSLAIGLAVQGFLSDLTKGVMLILFRPFKVGHWVTVVGRTGWIKEVGLFNLILQGPDKVLHIIPNHLIGIIDNSVAHGMCRLEEVFGISHDEDYPKVKRLLIEIVQQAKAVLKDPPPAAVISKITENGVEVFLRYHVKPKDILAARAPIREQVLLAFQRERVKCVRNLLTDPMSAGQLPFPGKVQQPPV